MSLSSVELNYDEFGDALQPTVIILHGFFASSRNWRQVAKTLATKYHVYVLDLRNHGSSPHHADMSYSDMVNDLSLFLENHQLETVHLLGHSMGGKLAMWFALQYPERVDKLIVADIAPVSYEHDFNDTINALKNLPLHLIHSRKQADNLLEQGIADFSFRQFHLQNLMLDGEHYRWKIDLQIFQDNAAYITAFPETDGVLAYQATALFVTGADSNYVLPDYRDAVDELFPKAIIKQIAGASHWLHVQQPQLFMQEIEAYLVS